MTEAIVDGYRRSTAKVYESPQRDFNLLMLMRNKYTNSNRRGLQNLAGSSTFPRSEECSSVQPADILTGDHDQLEYPAVTPR